MEDISPGQSLSGRPNKYKKIFEQLQQAIAEGQIRKEGQRIPSEAQLSRTCGASRLTVARALKDLEALGLIDRRPGSGSYVRKPVQSEGLTFGLLIPELGQTEIFEPICQGMARASRATHAALVWGAATRDGIATSSRRCSYASTTSRRVFPECFSRRSNIRRTGWR